MTRLVQLDRDDDVAAIRGRLETAPDDVVVLVAPPRTKTLQNPVHVRLVQRHAQQLGKELGLVTRDGRAARNARDAGIRVFGSVRRVPLDGEHLPPPGIITRTLDQLGGMAGWVTATLALASLAAAALIFLPSAEITIYPVTEPVDEAMALTATTAVTFPSSAQLKIPARLVEVKIEATGTAEGTGTRQAPDRPATGRVIITNRSGDSVEVPQGTRLVAEGGTEFTTDRSVTVQPNGATADVDITATEPGTTGNLGVGLVQTFADGDLDGKLDVTNPGPTQGGTTKDGLAVTAEDRAALRQKVLEQLREVGAQKVAAERTANESIYPETINVRAQRESFTEAPPAEGDSRPRLELKLEGTARALAFDGTVVNETVLKHLTERTDGRYNLIPESLKTRPLEAFQWNDEEVQFHLAVQAMAMTRTDRAAIVNAVAGRTAEEAEAVLNTLLPGTARPAEVKLWPFWASRVPQFTWRVGLTFATPANAPGQVPVLSR